jgi:tRNA A-37 threonylcarbamoyl transferase component Bud32
MEMDRWNELARQVAQADDPLIPIRQDQLRQWNSGNLTLVEEYQLRFPSLTHEDILVLLLAEIELRRNAGESIQLSDYQARFPSCAQDLSLQWKAMSVLGLRSTRGVGQSLLPPESIDEIGRIPGFRILQQIGAGGMGAVFEAEDLTLKRRVAIKMMLPHIAALESNRKRFLREARAAAKVEDPRIVPIYFVGEHGGLPFISMPFLNGVTLRQRIQQKGLSVSESVRIATQVAEALEAAHSHGLVHRDIKPENIWIDLKNSVKILDFGLSHIDGEDMLTTTSGLITGTPAYMAPEQALGRKTDFRADLYSLGVVLYEMLAGRRPMEGGPDHAIVGEKTG